jgi:hypothetical protein
MLSLLVQDEGFRMKAQGARKKLIFGAGALGWY